MFDPRSIPLRPALVAASIIVALASGQALAQASGAPTASVVQAYQELFSASQKEKRGLMFFVRGQQIGGAVTRVIGNDAVEIRNQTYGRIVIRIDQIDAVAIN